ncbi:MAG: hypothetical protein IM673_03795 [Phenylobacterium sp.]|uniref:hypothetical protein n=1 Tax=Phenylobacterium sp. TaxID=1871053 RepID=UPI0025F27259|nr:hypothetical protein [Phenylobacterium sp.]MCA3737169.1 hypothetical protein [Phenylobacterium sp.]
MPADPTAIVQATTAASEIWKTLIPAAFGLGGVVVCGVIQSRSAFFVTLQQRRFRLEDEKEERDRANAKVEAARSYARAVLARHLEAYARASTQALWANDDPEKEGSTGLPDLPPCPKVPRELLGANEMAKARDIEVRLEIQKDWVLGGGESGGLGHGVSWTQGDRRRLDAAQRPYPERRSAGRFGASVSGARP